MKKAILNIIILMLLTISCKKEVGEQPKSYWTVNGYIYRGFAETHPWGKAFDADKRMARYGQSTGDFISINFDFNYMPGESKIYKVMKYPPGAKQCSITVRVAGPGSSVNYTSIDSNSELTINVSPGGGLSASFSNLVLSDYFTGNTIIVSGYLEEQ